MSQDIQCHQKNRKEGRMFQKKVKCILGIFLILILASFGMAQRTTETGALNGTVSDDTGFPLPGVTITVTSPALMLPQISTVTDVKGYYRMPQLPVGLYTVVFSIQGFKTVIREEIKINLGMTAKLNMTLETTAIKETITVVGKAPTVDIESTSLGVNFDKNILQNIPSGRELTNIFLLAPGVIDDGGRPSSFGSAVRDNVFNLDGVSVSSPESGVYGSVQVGFEIAEELQVQTGGHTAEYGGVKGALINVITKSGGNKFSGEVNFYLKHNSFQSDNTKGTPLEGRFGGYNYSYDTNAQLGGLIVKDKLWFFVDFTRWYEETFVQGYPYDKAKNTPCDYGHYFPSLKLSYQLNPAMKLVGSWNGWWALRGHRSASMYRNDDSTWKTDFRSQTFNLAYSYQINSNMIFTAKAATAIANLDYLAKNDLPSYYEYDTQYYSGSMGYDFITERGRAQFLTDLTYFVDDFGGRHEFKTGLELNFTWSISENRYNRDPRNGIGYLLYTQHGAPYRGRDYENYTGLNNSGFLGGFIQDRWNLTDRLTLNLGLRFDHQESIIPKQGEDRVPTVYAGVTYDHRVLNSFKPAVWNNFSPRIGLSYALTGDAKTVLKANYGRYYQLALSTYFDNVNPNGFSIRYYTLNSDWSLNNMYSFSASSGTKIDPNLKAPYMDEIIVGIEREVIPDLSLGVKYIRKWDKNLLEDVVVEALNVDAIKNGEYIWSGYSPRTVVDPFNGKQVTFYEQNADLVVQSGYITNPAPANRNYSGVEVLLEKRYSHNWQLLASYVYSKATGLISGDYDTGTGGSSYFNNPNLHINALGRLPGERRNQIKVQASYLAPFGLMMSTYYRGFSGARYTRVIRSSDLGLNLRQGVVSIFAEERGSRGLPWNNQWDMRIEKEFKLKNLFTVGLIVDAFNLLNSNTTTAAESISSSSSIKFENIIGIKDPRILRLGVRVRW
jgi:hypothetical protein